MIVQDAKQEEVITEDQKPWEKSLNTQNDISDELLTLQEEYYFHDIVHKTKPIPKEVSIKKLMQKLGNGKLWQHNPIKTDPILRGNITKFPTQQGFIQVVEPYFSLIPLPKNQYYNWPFDLECFSTRIDLAIETGFGTMPVTMSCVHASKSYYSVVLHRPRGESFTGLTPRYDILIYNNKLQLLHYRRADSTRTWEMSGLGILFLMVQDDYACFSEEYGEMTVIELKKFTETKIDINDLVRSCEDSIQGPCGVLFIKSWRCNLIMAVRTPERCLILKYNPEKRTVEMLLNVQNEQKSPNLSRQDILEYHWVQASYFEVNGHYCLFQESRGQKSIAYSINLVTGKIFFKKLGLQVIFEFVDPLNTLDLDTLEPLKEAKIDPIHGTMPFKKIGKYEFNVIDTGTPSSSLSNKMMLKLKFPNFVQEYQISNQLWCTEPWRDGSKKYLIVEDKSADAVIQLQNVGYGCSCLILHSIHIGRVLDLMKTPADCLFSFE